ncbi:hypothetical protein JCM10295v2_002961 [Rhodotorula toruloides]
MAKSRCGAQQANASSVGQTSKSCRRSRKLPMVEKKEAEKGSLLTMREMRDGIHEVGDGAYVSSDVEVDLLKRSLTRLRFVVVHIKDCVGGDGESLESKGAVEQTRRLRRRQTAAKAPWRGIDYHVPQIEKAQACVAIAEILEEISGHVSEPQRLEVSQ